jgi:hypothetical protein
MPRSGRGIVIMHRSGGAKRSCTAPHRSAWSIPPADERGAAARSFATACPQPPAPLRPRRLCRLIRDDPDTTRALLAKAYPQFEPKILGAAFDESKANRSDPVLSIEKLDAVTVLYVTK